VYPEIVDRPQPPEPAVKAVESAEGKGQQLDVTA
jgi:hypothetical protein